MEFRARQPLFERVVYRAWALATPVVAWILWLAGPPENAQARAFAFARRFEGLAGLVLGRRAGGTIPVRVHVMNSLISRFCCFQRGFPVDVELVGAVQVFERHDECGVLIATVHTKLGLAANAALRTKGRGPIFVGFPQADLAASSWGSAEDADCIDARDPTVFLKIRKAIEKGRIVVAFVDFGKSTDGSTFLSPNLFAWAELANVPVMHSLATLGSEGRIRIEIEAERADMIDAGARARSFVDFLGARWPRRFQLCRPKELLQQAGAGQSVH